MIEEYLARFDATDRDRVFRFFAVFSRTECALKRSGFLRAGSHGQAEPDWNRYSDNIAPGLASLDDAAFVEQRDYLLSNPPRRQVPDGPSVKWTSNPQRNDETDARYLMRVVRDVRNNLFHGGKYPHPDGPIAELARDRRMIDAAMTVLRMSLGLNGRVATVFGEAD